MEVKKGYKQTEVGVIPEDWEVVILGSIIEKLKAGVSVNSVDEETGIYGHEFAVLKTSCVSGGYFYPSESKRIHPKDINQAKVNPSKDAIIISRMNTPALVGECGYVNENYKYLFLPDRLWQTCFRRAAKINARWLAYILSFNSYSRKIKETATGTSGSMKNIAKEAFLNIGIPLPQESEQTAIATALSDVDALIQSMEKLIAKKRVIKQGAMQELLKPKEGWVVKKLGEVAEIKMGQSPSSLYYNSCGVGLPLVQGNADIVDRRTIIRNYTSQVTKSCNTGDIILSVRAPVGEVAIASFKACIGRGVCAISYSSLFLYYYLIFIEPQWEKYSTGSTFDSVNSKVISSLEINIPSINEQTRIATILSDMDAEITALEAKLAKYKQIKQGMMQTLLTGRIRLI